MDRALAADPELTPETLSARMLGAVDQNPAGCWSTVRHYRCGGQIPRFDRLDTIAEALGVTSAQLLLAPMTLACELDPNGLAPTLAVIELGRAAKA